MECMNKINNNAKTLLIVPTHTTNVTGWYSLCMAQRDLLIHTTALNNKYFLVHAECFIRSFLSAVVTKDCARKWRRRDKEIEEGRKYCESYKPAFDTTNT